ncbi:MAG: ROK family protein [Chthoniobacterales bacterium]
MPKDYWRDERVVLTLDAGGTYFRFSATRGNCLSTPIITQQTCGDDLSKCLDGMVSGFNAAREAAPRAPIAISFGFPGPADYPNGVIGDLHRLPALRGGVPLAKLLEERLDLPVFINNDANLFAYGEAMAGLLPYVNCLLEKTGSARRYRNLVGLTLGSGFGGGIVCDGQLRFGDNSLGAEVWLLRNKLSPQSCAEDGANADAVRRVYAEHAGLAFEATPEPKLIFEIARGASNGDQVAAIEAFQQLGEIVGDALANVLTVIDGLAVIGGGLSNAWPVFRESLFRELKSEFKRANGGRQRRLLQEVFDLEDEQERQRFLRDDEAEVILDGSRRVRYNSHPRLGLGRSRLGTSEAIAIGAYCYALDRLDRSNA